MCERVFCWTADVDILGQVRLAATERGLCTLSLKRDNVAFRKVVARAMGKHCLLCQEIPLIATALQEIQAYLAGNLDSFSIALDVRGTTFQRAVWHHVRRIPYGKTSTYRDLAERIGRPKAVRAVGAANAANPLPLLVPCHRVIGTDGSLRGYGGGIEIKAALLQLEQMFSRNSGSPSG